MPVPTEIITRLIDVETELTIPEILFFRKTGEYEYNKENNKIKPTEDEGKDKPSNQTV